MRFREGPARWLSCIGADCEVSWEGDRSERRVWVLETPLLVEARDDPPHSLGVSSVNRGTMWSLRSSVGLWLTGRNVAGPFKGHKSTARAVDSVQPDLLCVVEVCEVVTGDSTAGRR